MLDIYRASATIWRPYSEYASFRPARRRSIMTCSLGSQKDTGVVMSKSVPRAKLKPSPPSPAFTYTHPPPSARSIESCRASRFWAPSQHRRNEQWLHICGALSGSNAISSISSVRVPGLSVSYSTAPLNPATSSWNWPRIQSKLAHCPTVVEGFIQRTLEASKCVFFYPRLHRSQFQYHYSH